MFGGWFLLVFGGCGGWLFDGSVVVVGVGGFLLFFCFLWLFGIYGWVVVGCFCGWCVVSLVGGVFFVWVGWLVGVLIGGFF